MVYHTRGKIDEGKMHAFLCLFYHYRVRCNIRPSARSLAAITSIQVVEEGQTSGIKRNADIQNLPFNYVYWFLKHSRLVPLLLILHFSFFQRTSEPSASGNAYSCLLSIFLDELTCYCPWWERKVSTNSWSKTKKREATSLFGKP